MKKFLNNIRSAENPIPLNKQIINTICILFIGIILGTFSKFLDTMPTNELPFNLRIDNIPFCNYKGDNDYVGIKCWYRVCS